MADLLWIIVDNTSQDFLYPCGTQIQLLHYFPGAATICLMCGFNCHSRNIYNCLFRHLFPSSTNQTVSDSCFFKLLKPALQCIN